MQELPELRRPRQLTLKLTIAATNGELKEFTVHFKAQ